MAAPPSSPTGEKATSLPRPSCPFRAGAPRHLGEGAQHLRDTIWTSWGVANLTYGGRREGQRRQGSGQEEPRDPRPPYSCAPRPHASQGIPGSATACSSDPKCTSGLADKYRSRHGPWGRPCGAREKGLRRAPRAPPPPSALLRLQQGCPGGNARSLAQALPCAQISDICGVTDPNSSHMCPKSLSCYTPGSKGRACPGRGVLRARGAPPAASAAGPLPQVLAHEGRQGHPAGAPGLPEKGLMMTWAAQSYRLAPPTLAPDPTRVPTPPGSQELTRGHRVCTVALTVVHVARDPPFLSLGNPMGTQVWLVLVPSGRTPQNAGVLA